MMQSVTTNEESYIDDIEHREHRYSVFELIQIINLETKETLGHVLDVNEHGIGIFSKRNVMDDDIKKIRLVINHDDKVKQFVDLNVEIRWCKKLTNMNKYNAGFEIQKATDKKSKIRLKKFIQYLSNIKESYDESTNTEPKRIIAIDS